MKNAFEKRPLCFASVAAMIISAASLCTPLIFRCVFAAVSAVLAAVFAVMLKKRYRELPLCAFLLALLLSLMLITGAAGEYIERRAVDAYIGDCAVSGYSLQPSVEGGAKSAVLTEVNGDAVHIPVTLVSYDLGGPEAQTCFIAEGVLEYRTEGRGQDGAIAVFTARSLSETGERSDIFARLNGFLRRSFFRLTDRGGLLSSVFAGNRNDLESDVRAAFSRLGVSHLLAVSGLHITAVLMLLELMLKGVSKRKRILILSLAAVVYACMTGLSGSVVRAAGMFLISRAAGFFYRRADSITSLSFAAALIIILDPLSVYDVGFLLSLSATYGILLFGLPLSERIEEKLNSSLKREGLKNVLVYGAKSVCISFFAVLFTLPITAAVYGSVNPASVIYTLILSPFILLILYIAPFFALIAYIPVLSSVMGAFVELLYAAIDGLTNFFAGFSPDPLSVSLPFSGAVIIAALVAIGALAFFTRVKRRVYLIVFSAFCALHLALAGAFGIVQSGKTELIVTVDRGDLVCTVEGRRATLYVFGADYYAYGDMYTLLLERGITRFDGIYMPLASEDGRGALERALSAYPYRELTVCSDSTADHLERVRGVKAKTKEKQDKVLYGSGGAYGIELYGAIYVHRVDPEIYALIERSDAKAVIYASDIGAIYPVMKENTYVYQSFAADAKGLLCYGGALEIRLDKEARK